MILLARSAGRFQLWATEAVTRSGVDDNEQLAELGRLGTRLVLQQAVEDEVTAFLNRARYERTLAATGSRNGSRSKRIQTAEGEITVAIPQVRGTVERFVIVSSPTCVASFAPASHLSTQIKAASGLTTPNEAAEEKILLLRKPYEIEDLRRAINRVLSKPDSADDGNLVRFPNRQLPRKTVQPESH